jgi:hypothetical protein
MAAHMDKKEGALTLLYFTLMTINSTINSTYNKYNKYVRKENNEENKSLVLMGARKQE